MGVKPTNRSAHNLATWKKLGLPGCSKYPLARRAPLTIWDVMVALDLSDGYYHFRVHPEDARFFQIDTPTGLYQIDALNMGWTRSPQVFTDALRPVVRELRRRAASESSERYLDDFLICGETPAVTLTSDSGFPTSHVFPPLLWLRCFRFRPERALRPNAYSISG